jgi:hypothetical protein
MGLGEDGMNWRRTTKFSAKIRLGSVAAQGVEEFAQRNGGEAGGGVGDGVGKDEDAVVDEGAAGIDDVGHVAFALVGGGAEEGLFETPDDARGIVAVKEGGADAVFAHGSDAVGEDEPTGVGFDGRTAVAELGEFPRL